MPKGFTRLIKQDKLLAGSETKLAAETGVNRNTLHYWLSNENARPSFDILIAYTGSLDCSDERKRDYFEECGYPVPAELLPEAEEAAFTDVPVVGSVHAGHTAWAEEESLGAVTVPNSMLGDADRHFYLIVEGDCMNKLLPEGSMALVSEDRHPINGNTVVVCRDDEEYMIRRYFKRGGTIRLEPESFNKEHRPIVISEKNFQREGWKIVGVATSAMIEL
ncbi:MAG: hypothetical protein ILO36_08575 [Abditibacteriota bacterium]|nr:hypothetical protein [Abditibacteriota bacterium]